MPAPVSRALVYAALLSLLAHALLSAYLFDRWDLGETPRHGPDVSRSLTLSLRSTVNPETAAKPENAARKDTAGGGETPLSAADKPRDDLQTLSEPTRNPDVKIPVSTNATPSLARALDLSAPEVDQPASRTSQAARSSTIFDGRLLQALSEAQARSGASVSSEAVMGGNSGSFVGGRWQSLVKIGKLCFEVVEADPLDTLSTEQWYRRDCD